MKRAAFIKVGSFSHINESLLTELRKNFPDYEFDVIDMWPDKSGPELSRAFYYCIREYGKDIILGKKSLMSTFARTSYYFNKRRTYVLENLSYKKYDFTFQTQSLFDASIPGVPHFLYTDHTHLANLQYPGFNKSRLLGSAWIHNENDIYNHTKVNFTMSSNITRSLIEDYHCKPENVKCVFCGSNVPVSEDEVFDPSRYSRRNILFVGVNWERKGGPVLADAFGTVLKVFPDATLTIAGCKPHLHLPNCTILGKISLEEIKRCYSEASLFCLPTKLEPFGIVFLEAMAHKLPVVATRIGAIPDFINEGKNGYLIDPDNSCQLARALIKLLESEQLCRDFGEYGSSLYWQKYTWKRTAEKMREHISRFLS
ncbi:MAG TPA: glycosyltransferase family 4 protein [Bacteroidales bacterium]|nr:glycosyltransferase family 4 protein [Bacteroidales bacterium]